MAGLTIGQVAQRVGVQASALRYYERSGLLPPPRRVAGKRRYDSSVIQLLQVIQLAKQAGFTISEIRTLLHGFSPDTPPGARWQALARQKLHELDMLQTRIQQMRLILESGLRCSCLRLEDCVIEVSQGCVDDAAIAARISGRPVNAENS